MDRQENHGDAYQKNRPPVPRTDKGEVQSTLRKIREVQSYSNKSEVLNPMNLSCTRTHTLDSGKSEVLSHLAINWA